ncbi:MAG: hypothetical protein HY904_20115 [Deltaproteobacteria bacterium]|nr:hypothetical protein [Deltaproteobacteria bacterium]
MAWRRLGWVLSGLALAAPARAGTFDTRGVLHVSADAALALTFDGAQELMEHGARLYDQDMAPLPSDLGDLNAHVVAADGAELEGTGYYRIVRESFRDPGPAYLSVELPTLEGRVQVSAWTRADSVIGTLYALYSSTSDGSDGFGFAMVQATWSGRRTSDDWVEVTTGPVDASVLGVPLRRLVLAAGFGNLTLDALEVRRVGDRLVPDAACTMARVEDACGTRGECIYGRCVDAAAVWGAAPQTELHRRQYTQRLGHIFSRFHANRGAVNARGGDFRARLDGLVGMDSPREFWAGVSEAVNFFRDGHTGPPMQYGQFYSSVPSTMGSQQSGALGVCLGLTELDLRGGGLGVTVFRTGAGSSLVGSTLRVGDVLVRVDGEPLATWLARADRMGRNVPSDPGADQPYDVLDLPGMLSARAGTLEFERCVSATDCANPTVVTVPVGEPVRTAVLAAGSLAGAVQPASCDGRFSNSVSSLAPPSDDGSDVVSHERVGEITAIQFDGFAADTPWDDAIRQSLAGAPQFLLFDTRLGNGGYLQRVEFLLHQLRDNGSPQVGLGVGRPWQSTDPIGYFDTQADCLGASSTDELGLDACAQTMGVQTWDAPASASAAKVAWLNTADISGNDYAPRLLQGRPGFRIFGPTRTAGAFGAITTLPPLLASEYYGGSIQVHDTRFADSAELLLTARYESGHGVPPDEVITQKLSDSLSGSDTMLARARAWLLETP